MSKKIDVVKQDDEQGLIDISEYYIVLAQCKVKKYLESSSFLSCINRNIFSFSEKNLSYWREKYATSYIPKKNKKGESKKTNSKDNEKSKILTIDNLMKFIIHYRKDQLKEIIKTFKHIDISNKKYIDTVVQNILKYEFIAFVEIVIPLDKSKQYKYPIFVYYTGEDNEPKSLENINNWKILNSVLLSSFHFAYKKNIIEQYLKDGQSKALTLEKPLFLELDKDVIEKLGYDGKLFKKPELLKMTNNKDVSQTKKEHDNIKMMALDPRFCLKYIPVLHKNKRKTEKTELKAEEEPKPIIDPPKKSKKEPIKRQKNTKKPITKKRKRESTESSDEPKKKKRKLHNETIIDESHDKEKIVISEYEGISDALIVSPNGKVLDVVDWSNRFCKTPINSEFSINDFVECIKTIKKKNTDGYEPHKITDALLLAHNFEGVCHTAITDAAATDGLVIQNEDVDLSGLLSSVKDKESYHEKIRNGLYEHINSGLVLSLFSFEQK